MFMRYYGGGIGHSGARTPSQAAFDDDDPNSDWRDLDADADDPLDEPEEGANMRAGQDAPASEVREARCEADVLALVPELAGGVRRALEAIQGGGNEEEQAVMANASDEEDEELQAHEDEQDGDGDGELLGDEEEDEYAAEGFAAP